MCQPPERGSPTADDREHWKPGYVSVGREMICSRCGSETSQRTGACLRCGATLGSKVAAGVLTPLPIDDSATTQGDSPSGFDAHGFEESPTGFGESPTG